MTPKEAFERIKEFDSGGEFVCIDEKYEEELNIVEQALTELEELKRDVKRFMELISKLRDNEEDIEMRKLRGNLLKVGKEQ
jgi:uncharacterized protein YwgA